MSQNFSLSESSRMTPGHQVKVPTVSTSWRSTMQDMVVVSLIVEELSNINVKCVKVTGVQNIGQGTW